MAILFTSDLIRKALDEDIGQGDITTEATVDATLQGVGILKAKEPLVVCGLGVFGAVFTALDPHIKMTQLSTDGLSVEAQTPLVKVEGAFSTLLKAERVALNFVQRLSGIATLTKQFVDQTQGSNSQILDTRKTTPLLRHLEKYAVKVGGGVNHRAGLYDQILIKDNHIAACGGSLRKAIERSRQKHTQKILVVEIASIEQLQEVLKISTEYKIDRCLLDNMSNDLIQRCVEMIAGRIQTEVSGGVTLERVPELSRLGVNYISVGALTHSARSVDLNFKITLL